MAHPVYVLLPDGVEWTGIPGTSAQRPGQVRWYLRQQMPTAASQVAVLVDEGADADELRTRIELVARAAHELGGVSIDATTQQLIDPEHVVVPGVDAAATR